MKNFPHYIGKKNSKKTMAKEQKKDKHTNNTEKNSNIRI